MIPFLKPLQGKKIALDTMIFIYAFEEDSVYLPHPPRLTPGYQGLPA